MRNFLAGLSVIKTWWKTPLLLGSIALLIASAAGIYSEVASLKHRIDNAVILWEPDLARAFAANDWLTIKRIGQSLRFDEVETISISSKKSIIYSFPENFEDSDCSIKIQVPVNRYGYNLGQVLACTSTKALFSHALRSPLALVISFALVVLLFVTSVIPLIRYRSATLRSLHNLRKWSRGPANESFSLIESDLKANDPVLMELMNLVREGAEVRIETEREVAKLRSKQELGLLAAQVAHDIRSPLAALEMATQMVEGLPEDGRLIVRNAIGRIHDIANSLLVQNRAHCEQASSGVFNKPCEEPLSVQLLASVLDVLISEKRMQFRTKQGIAIAYQLNSANFSLFAEVQAIEFRRMISNLINNAVEVLEDSGEVKVWLAPNERNDKLVLCIEDNGKGMSPEVISQLGKRGETHGKEGGSGLGLYHAYQSVEKWQGSLGIESEIGKGTKVIVTLPLSKVPEWFVSTIKVANVSTILILDDDPMYKIWKRKFEEVITGGAAKTIIVHVSSPDELTNWHANRNPSEIISVLYLCNYEMISSTKTGLDVIHQLGIGRQSILVTNHFEHPTVLDQCDNLGVKLIPKNLARFVEIEIEKSQANLPSTKIRPDAILIDDDNLIHLGWKLAAKRMNKEIRTYHTSEDFFREADRFDVSTPVYIDSNLKEGVKGQEVAKMIYDLHFNAIYLATGLDPSAFAASMPHIRGILGKDPPWK